MPFDAGWLASVREVLLQNLAKKRDHVGSNLEMAAAPFSRFFIKTTPNCCLTGVAALFCVQRGRILCRLAP
jgi:hypothetical protein